MIKNFKFFNCVLGLALFFLSCHPILAKNVYGLHLTQPSDLTTAQAVINSSGGDWGWATIVIRTDQLDYYTWQNFFDNCRKYHIIPIIRLATTMENNVWLRPSRADIDNLANFLNSLNWPSTPQHIILFNEINHGQEWGGQVDIKNFTDLAIYAVDKFKSLNPNFFILSPGLDLAAPEKMPAYKNFANVYDEIKHYKPEYFSKFDGLASHYYPQNSPKDFNYELKYFPQHIPIFITETGWEHKQPYTCQAAAALTLKIVRDYAKNPKVQAVTPFIYNYPQPPFNNFSWLDNQEQLLPEYKCFIDEPKSANQPYQITNFEFQKIHLPIFMFVQKEYSGQIYLKNTGQSIWGETSFCLQPQASANIQVEPICTDNHRVFPGQIKIFSFKFKVNSTNPFKENYLAWEKIKPIEISPLTTNSTIYRPKTDLKERINGFLFKK